MQVRFWGVRGSIAVSGNRYLHTGGNTPCVEAVHEGERLILDGGTGLRALGDSLGWGPVKATLMFSHVHWDHIQGVPFFSPAFNPQADLTFVGATRENGTLRESLMSQMQPPRFPITLDSFQARMSFRPIERDRAFDVGPFHVQPIDMNHPDGVLAFRVSAGGRSFVYATDIEHGESGVDRRLVDLAEGVDLLVHDAQYTEDEYHGRTGPSRRGWGHSMWGQAVEVARQAGVGRLALYHHDPNRGDDDVDAIESTARQTFPTAFAAREGGVVTL